ncbi:MAG: DUF488 family protein [Methanomicrobiales archaeon]|nr:DUF488 family protein [Methanomicrobiales archaeon]
MITKNERALLFLLSQTGSLKRMQFVKLMFLASKERSLYDFVPYQFGPFSFQLYQDMRHLEREGYLTQTEDEVHFVDRIFPRPDPWIQGGISSVVNQYAQYPEKDLVKYVYEQYPEMTIFSKIKKLTTYYRNESGITTIGYEGRNIDKFLMILVENKVGKLIDIRKNPFSMKYGYSKSQLAGALEKLGISYLHLPELGIESDQRQNLTSKGFADLFRRYAIELGTKEDLLDTIKSLAQKEKVALMCFEAEEKDCHRGVIARRFREEGLDVIAL